MSGIATGWVLRNGPRPDSPGADGVVYGQAKARMLRAVLTSIADAANKDGQNSHPGRKEISEASLYSPRTVTRAIAILIEDGWLEVQEKGGGRGMATVYRIPGVGDFPSQGVQDSESIPCQIAPKTWTDPGKPGHVGSLTSNDAAPTVSTTVTTRRNSDSIVVGAPMSPEESKARRSAEDEFEPTASGRAHLGLIKDKLRPPRSEAS